MRTTKNYGGVGALLFLVMLMTTACSIEKRRYSRGYHIEFGSLGSRNHPLRLQERGEDDDQRVPVDHIEPALETVEVGQVGQGDDVPHSKSLVSQRVRAALDDVYADLHATSVSPVSSVERLDTVPQDIGSSSRVAGEEVSPTRKWARLIGLSLLLMALVAGLTVPAFSGLYVAGDAAKTALNVTSDFARFRTSVGGWITILALDLLAALGIYKYSKDKEPKLAKITGASRLLYSIVLGAGVVQLLGVSATSTGAAIYHGLETFNHLWGIGLILFGVHLIVLAFLFRKEAGKNWLSTTIFLLLLVAGIGYIVQYAGLLLVPNPVAFAAVVEPIFIVPMLLGEVSYAIWKLVKGGKAATTEVVGQEQREVPFPVSE